MDIVERFAMAGFEIDIRRPKDCLAMDVIKEQALEADEPHFILRKNRV